MTGYPEWYQQLKIQKENVNLVKPEVSRTPFDEPAARQDSVANMLQGLQQEIDKIKGKLQKDSHTVNMAHTRKFESNLDDSFEQEYVGIAPFLYIALNAGISLEDMRPGSWIIDTGATTHMCTSLKQFQNISTVSQPIYVNLPDGTIKHVTQCGEIKLTPKITLKGVLYTSYFRFNLMSVNKMSEFAQIQFSFFPNYYVLQDLKTKEVLAKGKVIGGLYVLDNSFNLSTAYNANCNNLFDNSESNIVCNKEPIKSGMKKNISCTELVSNQMNKYFPINDNSTSNEISPSYTFNTSHTNTWHKRLAHAPYVVLKHVKIP